MEDLRVKVIEKLNAEFGSDVKNLGKCHELSRKLKSEKLMIEKSLSLASSEVPSKVSAAVKGVEEMSYRISKLTAKSDKLSAKVNDALTKEEASVNQMEDAIVKIDHLEHALAYLCCIKDVEDISMGLELSIMEKDDQQSVELYVSLCDLYTRLQSTACLHLLEFLKNTVHFWHNQLKEKFSGEFEAVLTVIKWPFLRSESVLTYPSPEGLQKFQILCEYLLQIQLPDDLTLRPSVTSALMMDFKPPSLPIALLLRPLQKRFLYHFYGPRQTNRFDKPEWFFTQTLTWVRDHENFVQLKVQPVMNKLGFKRSNAKTELMVGLVHLVVEKLHSELPSLEEEHALLAHTIDETLGFAKELTDSFNYPSNQPSVIGVLTQAAVFVRWIDMEKKCALEKMDAMLTSQSAWSPLGSADLDDLRVTECGESFLSLLLTITERYACLPQPGHRMQFLELQLYLLDDFRVRLLQLLREEPPDPLASKLPVILNTVGYVATVLAEWGALPNFLQLQFYKSQLQLRRGEEDEGEEGSVFDDALALYRRMRDDLLATVCESVMLEVKARSRPYRKDKWFAMASPKDLINPSLTPSVCPMFQVLAAKLHQLRENLSVPLFDKAWPCVARELNQFVYEEMILQNVFNEGGAMQLQYDMVRNLFPLFGQYTHKPDSLFPEVKESCVLLTLPRGSALLLRETLMTCDREDDRDQVQGTEVLADVGVHRLSVDKALFILNARADFSNL